MYAPEPVPSNTEDLTTYLFRELTKLQIELGAVTGKRLEFRHRAPERPREGDIYGADGTDWNPGSGQGVYCYYNGTWNKL